MFDRAKIYYPLDGIEPNCIMYGRRISRYKYSFTGCESDHFLIDRGIGPIEVSINSWVRRANRYKSIVINGEKGTLNKRA